MSYNLRKTHLDGGIFELLAEVVVEQAVLDAVDGLPGLAGEVSQAEQDEHGAGNVVAKKNTGPK